MDAAEEAGEVGAGQGDGEVGLFRGGGGGGGVDAAEEAGEVGARHVAGGAGGEMKLVMKSMNF